MKFSKLNDSDDKGGSFLDMSEEAERMNMVRATDDAAELLETYADAEKAQPETAARVAAYLCNNADFIRERPSFLDTMEAENEHLYASRMKLVPCGWFTYEASDMARYASASTLGARLLCPPRVIDV